MHLFSRRGPSVKADQKVNNVPLRMLSLLIIVCTLIGVFGFHFFSGGRQTPVRAAASWNRIWNDDFNGAAGSGLNTNDWIYDTGTSYPGGPAQWGTSEIDSATSSTNNVYQDGAGHLVIKALRDGSGNWTSGRIETQRTDFAAPEGGELAVEASIQIPNVTGDAAAGYWPAFWMLGDAYRGNYFNWPGIGEIDIMENVNGINRDWGTFHCGTNPGGPCNESTGLGGQRECSPSCTSTFHTYRVEYDRSVSPEQIRWYLDGTQFWQVSSNQFDATTWNNAVHHSFFIILDLAMGGGFPAAFGGGPTAATTSGVPMVIDYVSVYTLSNSSQTGNTLFSTGFESGQAQPAWTNMVDSEGSSGGANNVVGICCGVPGPEAGTRSELAYSGNSALMYSGSDTSSSSSYAYLKVLDVGGQNVAVGSNTQLEYWIYPQSGGLTSGSNSTCVAIDLIFNDGTNLRDSGATDQNGHYAHPGSQCNNLTLNTWNHVVVNLGSVANGKSIVRINLGYDQASNTGGYRGYIDDISIHN